MFLQETSFSLHRQNNWRHEFLWEVLWDVLEVQESVNASDAYFKMTHVCTCLSKLSNVMSFEACDWWMPCYLGSTFFTLQTSFCLQTQILFGKFRDQKCSSCVTFIYSALRNVEDKKWGVKIPCVYNSSTPFLQFASNPGGKWMSSGFRQHRWLS